MTRSPGEVVTRVPPAQPVSPIVWFCTFITALSFGACQTCPACPSCSPCPVASPCPAASPCPEIAPPRRPSNRWFVIHVTDGDTLIAKQVQEDGYTRQEKVRLLNIDTPEKDESLYQEATEALKYLVRGGTITLQFQTPNVENRGHYGRLLAYVFVKDTNVNLEMVRLGFSPYWTRYGKSRYHVDFLNAEADAKSANRGIWGLPAKDAPKNRQDPTSTRINRSKGTPSLNEPTK